MTEQWAVIGAFIILVIALLTMWFSIRITKIENSAVLIGLMIIPVVTYLILSGRLGEFKGPGGLEAKFVNAANQPLRLTTSSVETSLHPVQVTARGTIDQLPEVVKGIDKSKPSILTVKLGGSYTREDWLAYVRTILDQAPIAYAALVEGEGRLVAYMSVSDVNRILNNFSLGGELIRLIAKGTAEEISRIPGVQTDFVSTADTAIDVLRLMEEKQTASVIVVDGKGKIVGIAKREDVIAQIMLDIAAGATGSRQ